MGLTKINEIRRRDSKKEIGIATSKITRRDSKEIGIATSKITWRDSKNAPPGETCVFFQTQKRFVFHAAPSIDVGGYICKGRQHKIM